MAAKKKPTEQETKTEGASPPGEKVDKFERHLRVILTPVQVAEYADRAAHLLAERDDKEESLKAAQKQAKAEVESIEARFRELSGYVRDKAKYQEVACERRFDYVRGVVIEKRLDSGDVLGERAMTLEERQLGFDLDKKDDESGGVDDDFEDPAE